MKKIIVLALAVTSLAACNEQKSKESVTINTDTSTNVTMDNMDNATTTTTTYTPADGDISYTNGKLMVWRNNAYVEADNDVTLDDKIVVKRNGEATRNGVVIKLEDGERVSRTGRFFNRTGEVIEDGWDATKRGAKKVGEKVKDIVN